MLSGRGGSLKSLTGWDEVAYCHVGVLAYVFSRGLDYKERTDIGL